jgi:hypothetical protein
MISPYSNFENARLTFQIPTGNLIRDEVGNAVAETKSIKLTAILEMLALQSASKVLKQPGVDETALRLEGYCVSPAILDRRILPNNWAECVWSGIKGYFYLDTPINPPHGRQGIGALEEQAQGTKITGWFQVSIARG